MAIEGCCRSCPEASLDQRFTSRDMKRMPCGIGEVIAEYRHAKPSSSAQSSRVSLNDYGPVALGREASTESSRIYCTSMSTRANPPIEGGPLPEIFPRIGVIRPVTWPLPLLSMKNPR